MHIGGIERNTLLDYPGRVAATVFAAGCNLRCLFCQNSSLVDGVVQEIREEDVLGFLESRKGKLSGVCISGGEPTLQPDLPDFIRKLKEMDYRVKLDTNGSYPEMLKTLADEKLIDYIAIDIKTDKALYRRLCSVDIDTDKVEESIRMLIDGRFPEYEFRTTVVAEYYDENVAEHLAEWLAGAKKYYLQNFVDTNTTFVGRGVLHGRTKEELEGYADILRKTISEVSLRGID